MEQSSSSETHFHQQKSPKTTGFLDLDELFHQNQQGAENFIEELDFTCQDYQLGCCAAGDACPFFHCEPPHSLSTGITTPIGYGSGAPDILEWQTGVSDDPSTLDNPLAEFVPTWQLNSLEDWIQPPDFIRRDLMDQMAHTGGKGFLEFSKTILEQSFAVERYPDHHEVQSISQRANLTPQQVKTWFANKRSRAHPSSKMQFFQAHDR